jgi:hypothetical protein
MTQQIETSNSVTYHAHASLHSHALALHASMSAKSLLALHPSHVLTLQEAKVNRINAPLDWQNQRTMPMPPCMPCI